MLELNKVHSLLYFVELNNISYLVSFLHGVETRDLS